MVIPDSPGAEDRADDSGPGPRAVLTAVGLVLVALLIVGTLSRPGDEETGATVAVEEATTTTLPRLNDPLDWQAYGVGAVWPQRLVEFEGSLYFFATASLASPFESGSGLDAWLMLDGVTWTSLGTVIEPPNQIQTVSATPRELVAVGSAGGKDLHFWSSTDAVEWNESELPEAPSSSEYFRSWVQAVGGTDDATVVFASLSPDFGSLLRDALPPELLDDGGGLPPDFDWGGPPFQVNVRGPLGLNVFTATAEDLGLTEAEGRAVLGSVGSGATTAWTSIDGRTWTPAEIGIGYVNTIIDAGGGLIVGGYGASGGETWASPDGFEWERTGVGGGEHLAPWKDGFVAARQQGRTPDIAYSDDLTTWEPFGLRYYLDDGLSWQFQALAAGEGGLAAVLTGYDERAFDFEDPGPVVIERDGYELAIDGGSGTVTLGSGEDVLLSLNTYTNQIYEEVVVDFQTRTVTFLHPDSLQPLVSFKFDELEQAEGEVYGSGHVANDEQLIAFSSDGLNWSIEDASEAFGEDVYIPLVYVTDSQVVAVATKYSNRFSRIRTAPEVVIWSAVIPK